MSWLGSGLARLTYTFFKIVVSLNVAVDPRESFVNAATIFERALVRRLAGLHVLDERGQVEI